MDKGTRLHQRDKSFVGLLECLCAADMAASAKLICIEAYMATCFRLHGVVSGQE